jgi:NTP pyrophosphatase (non-canonical NTP hydrolase)
MENDTLETLRQRLRDFAAARDWDRYHSPKNLTMALIGEAGELIEHFQWLSESQSERLPRDKLEKVELELADILIYLVRLADKLNIDLITAANKKLKLNENKYPADLVRGCAKKYTEY